MNAGQLRTCILSLLMVLVMCGTGIATAWDHSDYSDNNTVHFRHTGSHDTDVDDVKPTKILHAAVIIYPSRLHVPEPIICVISPTAVQDILYPLAYITASFPSRAPPGLTTPQSV